MSTHPASYIDLCKLQRDAAMLGSISSLISWDQETYMPKGGSAARAEQASILAGIVHERRTSRKIGDLISACESEASLMADARRAANVREMRRDYDRATRLPGELVSELAKVGSQAQEVWKEARQKSDFKLFQPWLDKMMALTRRKAECYGVPRGPDGKPGELYDALLDEYEPDITAREIEAIFTPLRKDLSQLVAEVAQATKGSKATKSTKAKKPVKIDTRCLVEKVDPSLQHEFGQAVLRAMHFDLGTGRLDVTTHPFCSGIAPGDTRLTTRYRDEKFTDALYGTMHEGGHGLYEQGLPKALGDGTLFGTPLADAISLGIHESQSRMWENFVGRSREFWKFALPIIQKQFGKSFKKYGADHFFAATNTVTPSLIRVEADEGTYNMHVMIRFEIERALLGGGLSTKDLPATWNAKYQDYLGVKVPDDRRGCLQDVHWSFGLIGYFPTYTLGNLYAAQFWETINAKTAAPGAAAPIKGLPKKIAKGQMGELREWLRTNIHQHGRQHSAGDLCKKITGKPLEAAPLLRHLRGKAAEVYGI
jgi:carboxypeptidase Taq